MSDYFKPMSRMAPKKSAPAPIVAYDFETTRIPTRKGDLMRVKPLYITMHAEDWTYAKDLHGSYDEIASSFAEIWPKLAHNTLLCAYNANRFDLRVLLQALLNSPFTVEPFVSKVSGLRGSLVRLGRKRVKLLDPIAMLGMQCDLKTFVSVFAPEFPKGSIDFERVMFDVTNSRHVAYAKRDAECLYYALRRSQETVLGIVAQDLAPTAGALAIRSFMSYMPRGVAVDALRPRHFDIVRKVVMRGGYVFARPYRGKLWTYDLNQAYAYAMRACDLPSGRALPARTEDLSTPGFWKVKLRRSSRAAAPYMVRACSPPYRIIETYGEGCVTWLTSDEIRLLRKHDWSIDCIEGFTFEGSFRMRTFVNRLESRRKAFAKDHPVNVICKAIGCNAYGKTLQEPVAMRIVLARKPPKGAVPMVEADEEGTPIPGFWMVPETRDTRRNYERPQIGAWITAFVRCVVYDTIMRDPDHFIKADTDSVSFTRKQNGIPLSKWRYGAWKCESAGDFHIVIAKKVYYSASKIVAKGMRVKALTKRDFLRWERGIVPVQKQVQLVNFKASLAPAWRVQKRRGTGVDLTAPARTR